ncbi:MAG: HK97 family phage prohead protease [Pseudomonadota bacterium]|nr:HK97 family phage prohead protease [Pseudomonadota bacterium]
MIPARFPDGLELRRAAELRTEGRRLEGYAATFNTRAAIGAFTETIRPGAFRASLATAGRDVLALVDHDPGRLLARTSSGTLRLQEDAKGLAFSLDVPDTQLGRDVLALAQRGDIGGMSFGFRVQDEAWPAKDQRELRAVELVEISVVHAWPAYAQTMVAARSRTQSAAADEARRRRAFLETL